MYESEKLLFVQLQKTGSTHVARMLAKFLPAVPIEPPAGKHAPASPGQIGSGKIIVSSIRNPWDWYVSLWNFGAEGQGGLRQRLCHRRRRRQKRFLLPKLLGAGIPPGENADSSSGGVDAETWRQLYRDKTCVASFRKWLRLVLDPANAPRLGEGYHESGLASICGFMTYRYLRLCCRAGTGSRPGDVVANLADLLVHDADHCYVDYFIRQENLDEDLCGIIAKVRPLSPTERAYLFRAERTNRSSRALPVAEYYDKVCMELVGQRDRLIVDKFGYAPPGEAPGKDG